MLIVNASIYASCEQVRGGGVFGKQAEASVDKQCISLWIAR